jgi:hypothetical protein
MGNRYEITLDPVWAKWATEHGVSETVAAALFLLSKKRKAEEVVDRLKPDQLKVVVEVVENLPECFPQGTLTALRDSRPTSSPDVSAPSGPPGAGRNPYGIQLDDEALRWAAAEGVPVSVIAAIRLLHERSVDQIAARLTTAELEMVISIAGRSPQIYPPGAYAALKEERVRRLMQRAAARNPGARISPGAVRMRKTRERRRQNLRLVTIEMPLNDYEAAKRGDFAGIITVEFWLTEFASLRRDWPWPEHTPAAGSAHQQGQSAPDRPLSV